MPYAGYMRTATPFKVHIMKIRHSVSIGFLICAAFLFAGFYLFENPRFISNRKELSEHYGYNNVIQVASIGRSGSTMLSAEIQKCAGNKLVIKSHLLPPSKRFLGKTIFIFSNPNQAAESALHVLLSNPSFGVWHFQNIETSVSSWSKYLTNQTEANNLLSFDAFGTYKHLKCWLFTRTEPTSFSKAQILAVKYENLWDPETVAAIRKFLGLPNFSPQPFKPRGYSDRKLFPAEKKFRDLYNLGTRENPRYAAYEEAYLLWEQAPPYQFLRILP